MAHDTRVDTNDGSGSGSNSKGKWSLIIFGLIFAVAGFGFAGVGYWIYDTSTELQNQAVTVDGEIIDNNIEEERDRNSDSNRYEYQVTVEYQYEYDNTQYTNNNIRPVSTTTTFDSRSKAQQYANNNYPVGQGVDVYVVPDEPETAFLEEESSIKSFAFIGMGLLFGFIGLGILYKGYKNLTSKSEKEED